MGIVAYGHWGPPLLTFPTSGGNEWEHEDQGMIAALADHLEAGRVKIFTVDQMRSEGLLNHDVHPLHRTYIQQQYDGYIRFEAIPFIQDHCRTPGLTISTMGASLGAYHAVNTLLKHPDVVRRCYAMSGWYDIRRFMDGAYDDNLYFNNPVDYLKNLDDPWYQSQLEACKIRLITGSGPWENSAPSYELAAILSQKGIPHDLDDWGPEGGHDWSYWHRQMREYLKSF